MTLAVDEPCPMCCMDWLIWDERFPTLPVVTCPHCHLVSVIEDRRG